MLMPSMLEVVDASKVAFEAQFGLSWEAALEDDLVYNAQEACQFLGLDADGLDQQWTACREARECVKLGDGFYCGLIKVSGKPRASPKYRTSQNSRRSRLAKKAACAVCDKIRMATRVS